MAGGVEQVVSGSEGRDRVARNGTPRPREGGTRDEDEVDSRVTRNRTETGKEEDEGRGRDRGG